MALKPRPIVEVAFNSKFTDANPTYTDISEYVLNTEGIAISRWRSNELSSIDPQICDIGVGNSTGLFTPKRQVIRNGQFETNVTGWRAVGTGAAVARTTSQFINGVASLQFTGGSGGGSQGPAYPGTGTSGIPVLENCQYDFSCWVKAATTGRSVSYTINFYDKSGSSIGGVSNAGTVSDVTSDWTPLTYSTSAPQRAAFMDVIVNINGPAASEVHYVDLVRVIQIGLRRGNYMRVHANLFQGGDWGTFEDASTALTGFVTSNCTLARETGASFVRYGTASLKMTATAAATMFATGPTLIPVKAKGEYYLGAWTRNNGVARNVQLTVFWYTSGLALVSSESTTSIANSSSWTRNDGKFTCPDTAVYAVVRVTFISAGAGEVHWVDGWEFSSPRFTGFFQDSEVQWPNLVDGSAITLLNGASRSAMLGRGATLRSLIDEEFTNLNPEAYFPLSASFNETLKTNSYNIADLLQAGSGKNIEFSGPDAALTDSLNMAKFYAEKYLEHPTMYGSAVWTIAFTIETTATSGYFWCQYRESHVGAQDSYITQRANIDSTGVLRISNDSWSTALGDITDSDIGNIVINDGLPHTVVIANLGAVISVWVDGVDQGIAVADASDTGAPFMLGGARSASSAGFGFETGFDGFIGRVMIFDSNILLAGAQLYDNIVRLGFWGETVGARLARYAGYGKIPAGKTSFDTGDLQELAHIDITDKTVIDVMTTVAESEGGTLFDTTSDVLKFSQRSDRYSAVESFALSVSGGDITGAFTILTTDQNVENDVVATPLKKQPLNVSGDAQRVADATSIDNIGYYRSNREVVTSSATEAVLSASRAVQLNSEPENRIDDLTVVVTSSMAENTWAGVMAAELGTRFFVIDAPQNTHESTISLFVEGSRELINATIHLIGFYTSPGEQYDVFTFDDELMGRFDLEYPMG